VSRPRVFDRGECRNCVFKVATTAGTSVHIIFGESGAKLSVCFVCCTLRVYILVCISYGFLPFFLELLENLFALFGHFVNGFVSVGA